MRHHLQPRVTCAHHQFRQKGAIGGQDRGTAGRDAGDDIALLGSNRRLAAKHADMRRAD